MEDLKKNDTGGFDNFDYRGPNKAQYSIYIFSNIQYKEYLKNLLGMMKFCPDSAIIRLHCHKQNLR